MRRFSLASLRLRLILLVLLAIVPALGLILSTGWKQRRDEAAEAKSEALMLVRLAAANQERLIEESHHLLSALAELPDLRHRNAAACSRLAGRLVRQSSRYANIGAAYPDGNVFCSGVPLGRPISFGDRSAFQEAIRRRVFTVSAYRIGRITERPVLAMNYPMVDARRRLRAVIFAALDLAWLERFASHAELSPSSTLTVLDPNGIILAHHPGPENLIGKSLTHLPTIKGILGRQTRGTAEAEGPDGTRHLYAFAPLRGESDSNGAYVLIDIPVAVAYAEADRVLKWNIIGLGIVAVLTIAAAWVVSDTLILRPTNALVSATKQLAAGDLGARTGLPHGAGELGMLARAFDEMAAALEERETQRRQTEEMLATRTRQLDAVRAIGQEVTQELDVPSLLRLIVRRADELVSAGIGVVWLWDEGAQVLVPQAWHGVGEWIKDLRVGLGESVAGTVAERRRGMIVNDYKASACHIPLLLERARTAAVMAEPLLYRDRLVGVVSVSREEAGHPFTEHDRETLALFAAQAAIAIENARLFEQVRVGQEQLQALSRRVVEVQEAERRHLARELHDEIGQALTALKINLRSAELSSDQAGETPTYQESVRVVERLLEQVRSLSLDLRPLMLDDFGLAAALRWYVDEQAQRVGYAATFTVEGMNRRPPPEIETACFRVAQEALTNVARHARARSVEVLLRQRGQELEMLIRDDGVGFQVDAALDPAGHYHTFGLLGMRERVLLAGGRIQIASAPGAGTVIHVRFTLSDRRQEA